MSIVTSSSLRCWRTDGYALVRDLVVGVRVVGFLQGVLAVGVRVVGFLQGVLVVGDDVGLRVVGFLVGALVGEVVGFRVVGFLVGALVVGDRVGAIVHLEVEDLVGLVVANAVGL